jgi:hypothetical protein
VTTPQLAHDRPNPRTVQLRPPVRLSAGQAAMARDLRKQHPDLSAEDIARMVGGDLVSVERALAILRTRRPTPRAVLNVSDYARQFVLRQRRPGEPTHATMDRLVAILARLLR